MAVGALCVAAAVLVACVISRPTDDPTTRHPVTATPHPATSPAPAPSASPSPTDPVEAGGGDAAPPAGGSVGSGYPWHRGIVSTTFWVGEIFDPDASDGSQEISTYDSDWLGSYGGCDGIVSGGDCRTEARTSANDYFPTSMTPRENPFYLDLPYDDINDGTGFAERDAVIPWAGQEPYRSHSGDGGFSYLKNRWVQLVRDGRTCYGQIEDAGPGEYHDAAYVFGSHDARPANSRYGGAGLDVSPALTGCLGYPELDGDSARVDWRFVDAAEVPEGPWTRIVTTGQVR